ncbi:bifunctional nuclease family protein [Algoriphagus namhaensis]
MEKLIELEILGLSSNHSQSGSFTLVLGETEGVRRLPIVIGMFEAQAIAIEMEKIIPNRPMTHDLFKSFADSFHFHLDRIVITDMKEGVFYAKIHGHNGSDLVEIDSRPSDAIAIAVRFDCPILCASKLMDELGVELSEEAQEEERVAQRKTERQPKPKKDSGLKDYSLDRLNQMLEQAITDEDYEKAARIRDEINKRN